MKTKVDKEPGLIKYQQTGDDLGLLFYTFRDTSIVKILDFFYADGTKERRRIPDGYYITNFEIRKRFWLFGETIIHITMKK